MTSATVKRASTSASTYSISNPALPQLLERRLHSRSPATTRPCSNSGNAGSPCFAPPQRGTDLNASKRNPFHRLDMTLQRVAVPPSGIGFLTEQRFCARGEDNWYLRQPSSSGLATEVWSFAYMADAWASLAAACRPWQRGQGRRKSRRTYWLQSHRTPASECLAS
jgi:hypothetical protein